MILEREEGEERESKLSRACNIKVREIQIGCLSHTVHTEGKIGNLGLCPDWDPASNLSVYGNPFQPTALSIQGNLGGF